MKSDPAFDTDELAIVRRAFAKHILAAAAIDGDPRLERAFATVARERFLGPQPWHLRPVFGSTTTFPVTEPVLAYHDVLFALAPERGVNNGQPSLHAAWLHRAGLKAGDLVAHIGAGTGCYMAVRAEIVGPDGHGLFRLCGRPRVREPGRSCRPHSRVREGRIDRVRSLRWKQPADPECSWFVGADWALVNDA